MKKDPYRCIKCNSELDNRYAKMEICEKDPPFKHGKVRWRKQCVACGENNYRYVIVEEKK